MKASSMADIVKVGQRQLGKLTGLRLANVVQVAPEESGWHLRLELVEKESIPHAMDILGLYDAWLDANGTLLRFARHSSRRRGDVCGQTE